MYLTLKNNIRKNTRLYKRNDISNSITEYME